MQIIHDFLTINEYSRPAIALKTVRGIVMHWTANPRANAKQNRDFFETRKTGMGGYGSAHYIIDQNGIIVAAIPENEIAYHCGTSQPDPVSGKVYTYEARTKFPEYTKANTSPNYCTIGIEMCPTDDEGNFIDATVKSAIDLCADICKRYKLESSDIYTHHEIVGWKDCPRLWTKKPTLFVAFKADVDNEIKRG